MISSSGGLANLRVDLAPPCRCWRLPPVWKRLAAERKIFLSPSTDQCAMHELRSLASAHPLCRARPGRPPSLLGAAMPALVRASHETIEMRHVPTGVAATTAVSCAAAARCVNARVTGMPRYISDVACNVDRSIVDPMLICTRHPHRHSASMRCREAGKPFQKMVHCSGLRASAGQRTAL